MLQFILNAFGKIFKSFQWISHRNKLLFTFMWSEETDVTLESVERVRRHSVKRKSRKTTQLYISFNCTSVDFWRVQGRNHGQNGSRKDLLSQVVQCWGLALEMQNIRSDDAYTKQSCSGGNVRCENCSTFDFLLAAADWSCSRAEAKAAAVKIMGVRVMQSWTSSQLWKM